MPGIRLNDTERHLQKWWDNLSSSQEPFLKKIIIKTDTPIRGIKSCELYIKYPITILCGKNGSGKSTLLQLAALAFHHREANKRRTFKDFFYKTKYDSDNNGTYIEWFYTTEKNVSVHKGSKKWMHYERRPHKEVRVVSPRDILATQGLLCQRDIDRAKIGDFVQLSQPYLQYLDEILEKKYESAEELQGRYISKCSVGEASYSCLNMGIGERAIIHLLKCFQEAEQNSLIAIDEIEMGIHPSALTKLSDIMQKIAYEKKLQIFITTHSKALLDAFPREARVLVERVGDFVNTINCPSTIYSISRISNVTNAEVTVYCEDRVAASLIRWSAKELKTRIDIIAAGGKSELPGIANTHLLSNHPSIPVIYWDGDVSDTEMKDFLGSRSFKSSIFHVKFLSSKSPEEDILDVLQKQEALGQQLSTRLGIDLQTVKQIIQQVVSDPDPHNILHIFSQQTNIDEGCILNELIHILIQGNPDLSNDIYNKLKLILDGKEIFASSSTNKWEFKCS